MILKKSRKNIKRVSSNAILLWLAIVFSACSEPYNFEVVNAKTIVVDGELSTIRGESHIRIFRVLDYNREFSIPDLNVRVISDKGDIYDFRYSDDDKFYCSIDFYFKVEPGVKYRMEAIGDDGILIESTYDSVPMPVPFDISLKDTTITELTEFGVLIEKRAIAAVATIPNGSMDYFAKMDFRYSYKDYFSDQRIGFSKPGQFVLHQSVNEGDDSKDIMLPIGYRLITPWHFLNPDVDCDGVPDIVCQLLASSSTETWLVDFEIILESVSKNTFQYWEQVQQLTENDGLLFDTYPFPLNGNVNCENCDNPVIGLFRTVSKSSQTKTKST